MRDVVVSETVICETSFEEVHRTVAEGTLLAKMSLLEMKT